MRQTLSRPESSAGALVFCDCGNSLRVPWESTAAPAAETYPMAVEEPLAPVRFEAVPEPAGSGGVRRGLHASTPRLRRPTSTPEYCFNHPSEPKSATCTDCGLGFCRRASKLRGGQRAAPCKNYRAGSSSGGRDREVGRRRLPDGAVAAPVLLELDAGAGRAAPPSGS